MQFLPSPNFNDRAADKAIQHLILHYTGMRAAADALARLCDPAAEVSAHYIVNADGAVTQLVDEEKRAWHAGVSFWAGETDLNSTSIGIEIVNPGHEFGYMPFPDAQITAVTKLCRDILSRHAIQPHHVLAHSDIAPARKMDPGELFPWARLAEDGVGLWPPQKGEGRGERGELDLAIYGYDISSLSAAIIAFQRHFRPEKINGEWDDECGARLSNLLNQKITHTSQ